MIQLATNYFLVFFTPSMVYGPLRIILLVVFVFYINRLVSLRTSNQLGLDYFIPRYIAFVSSIVMLGFILTQLNAYDSFTILVVLFLFIVYKFLNLNLKKPLKKQLLRIRSRSILYTVRRFEQHKSLITSSNFDKKKLRDRDTDQTQLNSLDGKWQIGLAVTLGALTYASRYYFFNFDTFALSDLWYQDFAEIKNLYSQQWLQNDNVLMGEYALIQMYSTLTDISDVIALQSFGLLENSILAIVLFWFISKITNTKYVAGLIGAAVFILFYPLLPLNINLMTQHKPIFLALSLALPVFVFICKPTTLRIKYKSYYAWMLLFFMGISFTDFFTFYFLIPVFFVSTLFVINAHSKKYYRLAIFAYATALSVFLLVYGINSLVNSASFVELIKSNLYSLKSYTYVPQLLVPVEGLIAFYQIGSIVSFGVSLLLYFKNRERIKNVTAILAVTSIIFCIPLLQIEFIDEDLLFQIISVFVPILFSCGFYIVYALFRNIYPNLVFPIHLRLLITAGSLVALYFVLDNKALREYPKRNLTNEYIMEAYDNLERKLLPFSYAVVNTRMSSEMSTGSHFFLNYSYFNTKYETADSVYAANRNDVSYFRENPDANLPKSTFVFIYENDARVNKEDVLKSESQTNAKKIIDNLQLKGRTVTIFSQKPLLTVFEIVNEPKATKIDDLLF